MNITRIVIAIGLFFSISKYIATLIQGFDVFEGINDPKATWLDYLTLGAISFELARFRTLRWSVYMSVLLAVLGVTARWLLIITAWVEHRRWNMPSSEWQYLTLSIAADLILGVTLAGICGLVGASLSQQPWVRYLLVGKKY